MLRTFDLVVADRLGKQLPDGSRPPPLCSCHIEETEPSTRLAVGSRKGAPDDLKACADSQDHRPTGHSAFQRTPSKEVRSLCLWSILTTAKHIDIATLRQRILGSSENHLDRKSPPRRSCGQHRPVTAIPIGSEKLWVHDHDS